MRTLYWWTTNFLTFIALVISDLLFEQKLMKNLVSLLLLWNGMRSHVNDTPAGFKQQKSFRFSQCKKSEVSNNKHLLNLNGILQKFNLMQEIRRFWQKNRLNLNGILKKFNSMQEIRSLWQLKSVEFECNLAKNPMQEIRRFWQDESGGFECNLGKIEARSNFQARSRKSKDGKDKADGLAADQVDEQTPKIKIKMERIRLTGWLLTPKIQLKIKMELKRLTGQWANTNSVAVE